MRLLLYKLLLSNIWAYPGSHLDLFATVKVNNTECCFTAHLLFVVDEELGGGSAAFAKYVATCLFYLFVEQVLSNIF